MISFSIGGVLEVRPVLRKPHQLIYAEETELLPGDVGACWVKSDTTIKGVEVRLFDRNKTFYYGITGNDPERKIEPTPEMEEALDD